LARLNTHPKEPGSDEVASRARPSDEGEAELPGRKQERQQLLVVSGLSGGGKSTALHALEDLGFYCVDNLPAALLPGFFEQIRTSPELYARVALGIDARSRGSDQQRLPKQLDQLAQSGLQHRLLFLTADTRTIIKRFSETRRRHPLTFDQQALPAAIENEKNLLQALQSRADWVIDTSDINIHELRQQVWKFVGSEQSTMSIVLESFAYKRGLPQDLDFVFDTRHCPNPHWVDGLQDLTGLDEPVKDWLENSDLVQALRSDILAFLQRWLPEIRDGQRSYLTIGIGCTGGMHRSVYLVEWLATQLRHDFQQVEVYHRELRGR